MSTTSGHSHCPIRGPRVSCSWTHRFQPSCPRCSIWLLSTWDPYLCKSKEWAFYKRWTRTNLLPSSKKALSLNWILVPYNFAMAGLNGYIAWQLFAASHRLKYSYICEPCRPIHSPDEIKVILGGSPLWIINSTLSLSDRKSNLVVLHLQVNRVPGHDILHPAKEG